jgi:hypothetical protein
MEDMAQRYQRELMELMAVSVVTALQVQKMVDPEEAVVELVVFYL